MRWGGFCLAVVVLLAAGCGGSHKNAATTTSSSSTREFETRANAICSKYSERIKALPPPRNRAGIPRYVARSIPIIDSTFKQLNALKAPEFQRSLVATWLQTGNILIAELQQLRRAALRGDQAEVHRISVVIVRNNSQARQYAQTLGLHSCAGETNATGAG